MKKLFYSPTCGEIAEEEVIQEMIKYISECPEKFYDIIVGCDSSSGIDPTFPVAVAILRRGEGGRFFLKKIKYPADFNKRFANWKNRILQEVLLSCEMALVMRENFEKQAQVLNNYEFRYIHADIGETGQTKDMVKELTGLIRGNGFEPKIKPDSYVASSLADRYS